MRRVNMQSKITADADTSVESHFCHCFFVGGVTKKKSNIPVQYNDINLEIRTHLAHHLQNKRDFYRCIIELRNTADVRKIEAITTANGNALQIIRVLAVKQDKMGVFFHSMAYGYLSEDSLSLQDLLTFFENPFSLNFGALACDF